MHAVFCSFMRRYKFLDLLTIAFIVVLLVSNLVGPKICQFGPFDLPILRSLGAIRVSAAQLLFPLTYICGDIFTEVYGYSASRRAIWLGFFAMGLLSVMGAITVALPAASDWHNQEAFATVFGLVPRFAIASLVAYWAGEFTNSYTLAKLKLLTKGRWLWTRTIGSTVTGQAIDTATVVLIAFYDAPWAAKANIILSSYVAKVLYEVLATPITYAVVYGLKKSEHVDTFDDHTSFNPFRLRSDSTEEHANASSR